MATLRGAFVGSGQQLVACAERWLERGHRIVLVITDCPEVSAFTKRRGLPRIDTHEDHVKWLGHEPFDYLFSIINHAITPAAVLAMPQRLAINYHDSPLPRYGGFNATTWAILDGQRSHAVTWHEMTAAVDGGRILLQTPLEIRDDDTAFTLGVRSSEAGVSSFGVLLDQLEAAERTGAPLGGEPQGPGTDFHFRSDRPDLGLLDCERPAHELSALVRSLNFGPEDNWMCKPKLFTAAGFIVVSEARAITPASAVPTPGTVIAVRDGELEIAAAGGALCLSELTTTSGAALMASELKGTYGLAEGRSLPRPAASLLEAARGFDRDVTKHERFWIKRLLGLTPPSLSVLKPQAGAAATAILTRSLPAALRTAALERRRVALTAALGAYLTRVGEGGRFDLALAKAVPPGLEDAYATSAPLCFDVKLDADFAALEAATTTELGVQEQRKTYARDAVLRYRKLRERGPLTDLPIGVCFAADAENAKLIEGTALTLVVTSAGERYGFAYDPRALSAEALTALSSRLEVLLEAGLAEPRTRVAELPLLPPAERSALLTTWQDTTAPYEAGRCVHELFEQQVARSPDATAVVFRGATLTYRELNRRANRVARALRAHGVGPDVLVGISIERSLNMMIGLLGIQKAGGAYVPLDPVYPRERLSIMLEDSKAPVLLTQRHLAERLPAHGAQVLCVEDLSLADELAARLPRDASDENLASGATPDHLAYVIFTSGSTGRPKGVMVRHRNVSNFFTGMDAVIGTTPGVWLAVTSISFDISVLELFWTLTRGFEVVIQEESDRASLAERKGAVKASSTPMAFGLFYFAADSGSAKPGSTYRLLLEGARFADTHDFATVWTPERHFHAFGGLYPNPAVTTAALATITSRVALRAGSVVLPLHNPLRVAEDWAVIDQLSNGRVGLSFASGWHVNDFAFMPENYERRREVMLEHIDTVLKLWRGEKVPTKNGMGQTIEVSVLPRPVQERPPLWIASAGSVDTFKLAGKLGVNVLTNMLGQDLADLKSKLAAYREARREHGHEGRGQVSVMLHTFVCGDSEEARRLARKPFGDYLASSFDLVKVAPWMFPAFRQPSKSAAQDPSFDPSTFNAEDLAALLDHAFDRYFDSAGLFGTPERALAMVEQLKSIGVDELACLIDFGIDPDLVLASLPHLDRLRQLSNPGAATAESGESFSIVEQLRRRKVTHLQCTPSMARMLVSDAETLGGLRGLSRLMLGGEALPTDLVEQLLPAVGGEILNMYGPTETTIWSTTAKVQDTQVTIGRPIANTVIRILDAQRQLVPIGTPGELCIGGAGVVRGYLGRTDLTAERFVPDPYATGETLYRTGDLARYRDDGNIEFLGRLDHQVKVNGYRIELGEIETVLSKHPAIRQNVVMARSDNGAPAQLVGYVITGQQKVGADGDKQRVAEWQSLWNETYKEASESARGLEARFNIAGWNDSYTGTPIPSAEMREWLEHTAARILAHAPKRVLEIGCGTGMILYRLLSHVERYIGVDLSSHALESIRRELSEAETAKVMLLEQPAHALAGVTDQSCDTVVINSVAQYFPDPEYLIATLRRASELVEDGGRIFVGDVRSLAHLPAFQTLVELHHAPAHLSAGELAPRIARRVEQEGELLLDESFFQALAREIPRIAGVDVRLKAALAHNEMSCFRYDVVLYVGSAPDAVELGPMSRTLDAATLPAISAALVEEPAALLLTNLENARLHAVLAAGQAIADKAQVNAEQLRQSLAGNGAQHGVDPGALSQLDARYDVELMWASPAAPGRFTALLRHKQKGPRGRFRHEAGASSAPALSYANRPAKARDEGALIPELRAHLREFLPEYMVPTAFVVMDSFPLTPNGKIDRKALPAPARKEQRASEEYQPPSNDLERIITDVWKQMLNVERVGRRDNIFDLGANSLLTVQANNRLSTLLERKVSLVSMFRFPTVESLAAHLGDNGQASAQSEKRQQEQADRKKDAAARRRELREGRGR